MLVVLESLTPVLEAYSLSRLLRIHLISQAAAAAVVQLIPVEQVETVVVVLEEVIAEEVMEQQIRVAAVVGEVAAALSKAETEAQVSLLSRTPPDNLRIRVVMRPGQVVLKRG